MTREPVTYFSRLDADECWALLADAEVGRIAWLGPDGINIVPVNYRTREGVIVFHTAPGTMLATLLDATDVSFQVDEIDKESAIGWTVLARGATAPADAAAKSISWVEGDRTVGIAIEVSVLAGRVVSGTKSEEHRND
ncbi:MAG TPA: pyridoxamine 5'-phosphate oxidase family protein [Arachnia sp.]|jgi:nitroimidazol reductase NimA-like FMN-containing flavoprotein (pyridoxamine 5'-phosphate oxidase superfamily)|nr:pyridoxamine 5'-phosphate oxidase family protein [Arachnia sp.]HOA28123.1 pyridoxamine 5'-phosphate oxidase family protein [Arachnia sp.]HQD23098.1 pyridoxamine 5'-phosphate oxidase family protein [Arachnia sp.]